MDDDNVAIYKIGEFEGGESIKERELMNKKLDPERKERKAVFEEWVGADTLMWNASLKYLRHDVLLLLDCLNIIRESKIKVSELDPFAYLTSQTHSFDWMLKETGLKIQLLDDINLYREAIVSADLAVHLEALPIVVTYLNLMQLVCIYQAC